jgi:D-citramalate synthase
MVQDMGFEPTEDQLRTIARRVKAIGDTGKVLTDSDLYAITKDVMNLRVEDRVKLDQLLVVTGNTITPTSSVTLIVDGNPMTGSGVGNGPIDSAINAIRNVVGGFADISLEKFMMKAITGGTDAVADVTVGVKQGDKTVTASSVHGDTVMASVEAILKGMNRLLDKKEEE